MRWLYGLWIGGVCCCAPLWAAGPQVRLPSFPAAWAVQAAQATNVPDQTNPHQEGPSQKVDPTHKAHANQGGNATNPQNAAETTVPVQVSAATAATVAAFLPSFTYVPTPTPYRPKVDRPVTRTASQKKVMDLFTAGQYREVAKLGSTLHATEPMDDELQLAVANSLAWTGKMREAVPLYQPLLRGPYAIDATLGLANLQRWSGRDDLARPMYRSVLSKDPDNETAKEGLELANTALRPRTTYGLGTSSDSGDIQAQSAFVRHQWRDDSGSRIFEVEVDQYHNWLPMPWPNEHVESLTFRYRDPTLPFKPGVEVSTPIGDQAKLFLVGRMQFFNDALHVATGTMYWGKMAGSPHALQKELTASFVTADANFSFTMGSVFGRIQYYEISDGNELATSSWSYSPSFLPGWPVWGGKVKPIFGLETRHAAFNTPNYWSPSQGSGTAFAGLTGEWLIQDWLLYGSGQVGTRMYGDAGNSWSFSLGGRYPLTKDTTIQAGLWSMASWRDGATYRAQSATVQWETLWR
ncbi:tetratricopeptide repeat protein [Candidatus Symbiobacter mobilis]|uniref:TPR repeat protein n=1 Tax=Candidatus Symbiobacter mobilis CR TaxID=946483 RepID=U5N8H5_9BURK|nr:hypothetical protein [Candidatus Symbiobacter mobilis]AGX86479.1 hypothetical protein Cenrod_0356 [Candidatus Symbiobacter mobilis CR]